MKHTTTLTDQHLFLLLVEGFQHMLSPKGEGLDMPVFEGAYQYGKAGHFDRVYSKLNSNIKTLDYAPVTQSFVASIDRLASLYEMPTQIMRYASILSISKAIGRARLGINPEDTTKDGDEVNKSGASVYAELAAKREYGLAISENALGFLLGDIGQGTVPAQEGIEALFAAMLMMAYATFETLAADLWVCAVNRHVALATNWAAQNKNKQLTMEDIYSRGGDLSKISGSALHQKSLLIH